MRIESVEKRASGTVKIAVGGSSFLFREAYLAALDLEASIIFPGNDLDEDAVDRIGLASAATEADRKAIALLARAEQSRFLLAAKLEKRDCEKQAVSLALDFLEKEGLLSDRRFAEAWLRSKHGGSGSTPRKLLAGLRGRGIDAEVSAAAMALVFGADERNRLLGSAAEKEWKRLEKSPQLRSRELRAELKSRLRALGFRPAELAEWLESEEAAALFASSGE